MKRTPRIVAKASLRGPSATIALRYSSAGQLSRYYSVRDRADCCIARPFTVSLITQTDYRLEKQPKC